MRAKTAFAVVAMAAAALAGCVDQMADANLAAPQRLALARNPGVSPSGATIAFASLDGAPAQTLERFVAHFRAEAGGREIVMAEPGKARYLVRGYLSAAQTRNGAVVSYVWDVFDSGKRRALRMSDQLAVSAGGDVWSALDERALQSIAAKSADDLAAFLSHTPEAVAAAGKPAAARQTPPAAPAPADEETLALAP